MTQQGTIVDMAEWAASGRDASPGQIILWVSRLSASLTATKAFDGTTEIKTADIITAINKAGTAAAADAVYVQHAHDLPHLPLLSRVRIIEALTLRVAREHAEGWAR